MKLYHTIAGWFLERDGSLRRLPDAFGLDALLSVGDAATWVMNQFELGQELKELPALAAPIHSQEVWAAGVTYWRSRTARMEESKDAGGGSFYDRVYEAQRPELFVKSSPHRVVGTNQPIRIRSDSNWNVPEPELTLVVSSAGRIIGYTIGNDVSSRDIEGENPLYLPQAKVYAGSCALGPSILIQSEPLDPQTPIRLEIRRDGGTVFEGSTDLSQMRRKPQELVDYLFRDNAFPAGCFLMTGTGIVPGDNFTLRRGDEVTIAIDPIGRLVNTVA